jgi:hypothetical protein
VEFEKERAQLLDDLGQVYHYMHEAKRRHDWRAYHRLRRSWLHLGRIYMILSRERQEEHTAQLSLLPDEAGRHHDQPPAA